MWRERAQERTRVHLFTEVNKHLSSPISFSLRLNHPHPGAIARGKKGAKNSWWRFGTLVAMVIQRFSLI